MKLTRRGFVATGVVGLATWREAAAQKPAAPAPAAPAEGTLAEAEKLLAVEHTAGERKLIAESIGGQIETAKALRNHALANDAAPPATVFVPGRPPAGKGGVRASRPAAAPPPGDADVAFAPVTQLAQWIRTRRLTSESLTRLYLARLKTIGARLEAVITLTEELALEQARAADAEIARGRYRGPLHGIPYGAKDLLDTRGIATTWGIELNAGRVPAADAAVVRRLRDAGAVLAAKLSLGELAMGDVWYGGTTRNPWNPEEGSSGSSAGPAATVAAGCVGFAVGSETLGSIVSPSMRCGVTGLRPTFGRVARTGAMTLCWSLDKLGPIARTVEDTLHVLAAMNGADAGDASSVDAPLAFDPAAPARGLRAGHAPSWLDGERANEVDRAALEAARRAGLQLVEIAVPELPWSALRLILQAEAAASFEELTLGNQDDRLRQQTVHAWPNGFRQSRFISGIDLIHADRIRRQAMAAFAAIFEKVDVLIGPSYAPPMLLATNFTGHPSLTLRAGFIQSASRGFGVEDPRKDPPPDAPKLTVPYGVTLWGRLFDEGTLCRAGMALEKELGVWARRPPV